MIELWSVPTANGQKVHSALEEAGLAERAFACGEAFSVPDCLLFPVVATSAKPLDGWIDPYPALRGWHDRTRERPGVKRGMAAGAD
jgi:GST-like protein